jgi:hypothetical protein
VTGIELGLTTTGAIYTVKILGNGYTGSHRPNAGCSSLNGTKHTLTVAANERVTVVEAWRNSDFLWYRIRLTLNTGAQPEYNPTHGGTDTLYTYTVPAEQEFTGFLMWGKSSGCQITELRAISRADICSISIDLSLTNGQSQNVITDQAKSIPFTATSMYCGLTIEYQVTYSPTNTTTSLIYLPTSTTATILFASTTNTADAKTYTVTLSARPVGTTTWLSPTTATYTYNNPCLSATLTILPLSSMTNSVLKQMTPGGTPYYETQTLTASDSVSAISSANACGNY